MGYSDHLDYARYHEVLNRAVWSPRGVARVLSLLQLQHHLIHVWSLFAFQGQRAHEARIEGGPTSSDSRGSNSHLRGASLRRSS